MAMLSCANLSSAAVGLARSQDLAQLLADLDHGLGGLVGLHAGARAEHALPDRVGEARAGAVRPVLVLAQVHVEARDEIAAQQSVERDEADVIRIGARRAHGGRHDLRLLGARAGR